MRSWPVRLAVVVLSAMLLLCFLLPFRAVSQGMNAALAVPGYAMLMGFSINADGNQILVPPQPMAILGFLGAFLLLAWAIFNYFRKDRGGAEGLAALAGMASLIGFTGQSLIEPGAFATNQSLPKIVRDLFFEQPEPAAVAVGILSFAICAMGIVLFLTASPSGIRLWSRIMVRRLNAGAIFVSILALFTLLTPLKVVDLGKGERMAVYGFSLLAGTTVTSGGQTVMIPPQPFLIAFAALAVLTILLALVKLPARLRWLLIGVPALSGLFVFTQILYEMFVYNVNPALPEFARQLLSGKYSIVAFLAIGAVFIAAVIGFLINILASNKKVGRRLLDHSTLYLFMLPGLLLFLVFNYLPMFGVVMAFQKFDPVLGFFKSQWIGLQNFIDIFKLPAFLNAFRNTLVIATIRLAVEFPMPILFALFLNELRLRMFKRTVQSISYLPNFISWVIVSGIWYQMLSPDTGIVNQALVALGLTKDPIFFMQEKSLFYPVLIFTSIWKNLGFSSILYMASIAAIDPEQYEAAKVDGAGRFRQMVHITLPGMKNTIVLLFILAVAGILNAGGFDQIWTMGNAAVRDISEILDTLVLRYLTRGDFRDLPLGAAMGTFKAVVGLILFFAANFVSRKLNQESLI